MSTTWNKSPLIGRTQDNYVTPSDKPNNNSLRGIVKTTSEHSLNNLAISGRPPLSPYRTFANRVRHSHGGTNKADFEISNILESDEAIQNYYNSIRTRRGNNGYLSNDTRMQIRGTIRNFCKFADLPISNTTFTDLIRYKKEHPTSSEIEQVLQKYSVSTPFKYHASQASWILGLFRANFTPLQLRINTHFPPAIENCSEGTFIKVFNSQDEETKDMIQWGQYCPERATAVYLIPFNQIDLSRNDYAIVTVHLTQSKSRTEHPMFVPIDFARKVVERSKASGRKCPFPNFQSLWRNVTDFAKREYTVTLNSKYLRKRYVDIADSTTMPKSQAAFIMGDKTKIAKEGIHLDLIYGRGLRFIDTLIRNYTESGLANMLLIKEPFEPFKPKKALSKQEILAEIERLRSLLQQEQGDL